MASAEGGSVPSEVGYGTRCPLSGGQGVWGSVVNSPSGVRGRVPPENGLIVTDILSRTVSELLQYWSNFRHCVFEPFLGA